MADLLTSNALLTDEEKKKQEQGQPQDQFTGTGTSGVVSGAGGGNALASGNTSSQPWTNVQAYLGANKDNNSSSKLLEDNVGSQLSAEKQNYDTEAGKSLNAAKEKTDESSWVANNFNNNLGSATSGSYNNDYLNRSKNLLNNNYQAQPFSYAANTKTTDYGNALKKDDSFYNLQNDLYTKAAGGSLSSGQKALQTQLDANNENLASTRDKLLKDYAGFSDNLNSNIAGVNNNINEYQNQYNTNKNNLSNSVNSQNTTLNNSYNDYQNRIDALENERKSRLNSTGYFTDPNGDMYLPMLQQDRYNSYMDSMINPIKQDQSLVNNQWNFIKQMLGA